MQKMVSLIHGVLAKILTLGKFGRGGVVVLGLGASIEMRGRLHL